MIQRFGPLAVVLLASCGGAKAPPPPAPAPAPAPTVAPTPSAPTPSAPPDIVAAWDDADPTATYDACYVLCADGVALIFMAACADASVSVFAGAIEYTYDGNTFVLLDEETSPSVSVVEDVGGGEVTFTDSGGAVMRLRRSNVAPGPICEAAVGDDPDK